MKNNPTKINLPKSKKIIFNSILIILPVLAFILIELLLRLFNYGDNFNLFIRHPDEEYKQYKVANPEIGKKYFSRFEYTKPAKDIFLKEKPENGFRIFIMGSSTVAGFPYNDNMMFSRILNERLEDAYPDKQIEVVNTAITAINTFTLLDFMPQILDEEPDAILIYAGHNEFYGAFGIGSKESFSHNRPMIRLHLKLMNFRVYQLIRNIISGIANVITPANSPLERRGTLMARIVDDADILYNSEKYQKTQKYFEKNLSSMLKLASKKDVPVFVSDLVSNVRDIKPFKSLPNGTYKPAIDYYNTAVSAEQNEKFQKARENYILARDYDCVRFRATSDINKAIEKIAGENKATFVHTLNLFERSSNHGIVGNDLLTEHVHPNIYGSFLMADAFYRALISSKIIAPAVNRYTVKPIKYYVNTYGFTQLDYLLGHHRITNLMYHWPYRDDSKEFVDYRKIYQPVSLVDSLAFNIMAGSVISLDNAHAELAKKYEEKQDYYGAFREYNALVKINPYWAPFYRDAADCLLKTGDLSLALKYFSKSLVFQESSYAYFRAGEIYLIKNDLKNAIRCYNASLEISDDNRISKLSKLYIAQVYDKDSENASHTLESIREDKPGFEIEVPPKAYTYLSYIPVQIQPFINEANARIQKNDFRGAENTLLEALLINDSPVVNKMLGELYFKSKDIQKSLFHFLKVYSDYATDPSLLQYLIITYVMTSQQDKALQIYDQLLQIDPDNPGLPKLRSFIEQVPVQ